MLIEILGPGCAKCEKLAAAAEEAAAGLDAQVVKVNDILKITERGVLFTPAIAIDGDVKSTGKVLTVEQIRELITR